MSAAAAPATDGPAQKAKRLKVLGYFVLWYLLNIGYNISNKATLNRVALPWLVSSVQLVIGSMYIALVWGLKLRKAPKLSKANLKTVFPLAALHTTSHISAVIGLGAGAVGFVHVVKALEPLFTAALSALLLQKFMPLPVYASLLPVVGGVALASMKELSFSWVAFAGAMGSNVAAATRGVLAKKQMGQVQAPNMDPGNLYGVMTLIAAAILFPAALVVEGPRIKAVWAAAQAAGHTSRAIWRGMILSGLYFYLYNEVAFYCLNSIDATTHAVGNTVKRVVLLGVSVLVFGHQLTPLGATGSAVAIGGVLVYSLTKNHYAKKEAAAAPPTALPKAEEPAPAAPQPPQQVPARSAIEEAAAAAAEKKDE
ncbi:triose-phosphate transporter family-domain-containing protein [Tribonema minus]|uniref:Triose-phosphate transporter family-domain-containing protein n=1 Tax=Tribonema minus TaxID=303371 RepID=A0A835ZDI5_9STRA|nr:triose-phosphate transporter family-domain-containing protein [Tribonema minus]